MIKNKTADEVYQFLVKSVMETGKPVKTRGHKTRSLFNVDKIVFTTTPLVTVRKTAWKKAIREMEWFLSGDCKCPEELLDWWDGQLNPDGEYIHGYGDQLRNFSMFGYDQVKFIQDGLINNPSSRRLIMTTWNPLDMRHI